MAHVLALVAAPLRKDFSSQRFPRRARPGRAACRLPSAFVDATGGPILPLCAHFGEAFSAWVRRPAEVDAELQAIDAGYDCIRFWDHQRVFRGVAWRRSDAVHVAERRGHLPSPHRHHEKLEQFLALLKRRGLAAHHSRGDLAAPRL